MAKWKVALIVCASMQQCGQWSRARRVQLRAAGVASKRLSSRRCRGRGGPRRGGAGLTAYLRRALNLADNGAWNMAINMATSMELPACRSLPVRVCQCVPVCVFGCVCVCGCGCVWLWACMQTQYGDRNATACDAAAQKRQTGRGQSTSRTTRP